MQAGEGWGHLISCGNFKAIKDIWSCINKWFLDHCEVLYDEFEL